MPKKTAIILITFLLCLTGYFISKQAEHKIIVHKEIVYQNNKASEAFMVWGINYMQSPPKQFIPSGSYIHEGVVYTKMVKTDGAFRLKIGLPYNTILNYWIWQTKDSQGNTIDIWDSGGSDREYSSITFISNKPFSPGYFILLSGLLPLLLLIFFNRDNPFFEQAYVYKIPSYIPQFDSIRAVAVILVIIHHWFENNKVLNFFPNGALGVNIFFVLSGFLITGILLKAKKQVEALITTNKNVIKIFYIRRTLRIFPIYYLLLIILFLIHDSAILSNPVYFFTYTSNFLFFNQQFFPARVAHLWSLAVEEQFYILWPWLIIFSNKKWLPYFMGLFLIIGISSNYIFINHGWWVQIFTPACFDAFAIGGFLSFAVTYRHDIIQKIQKAFKYISIAIFAVFLLSVYDYSLLPVRTIHSLLAVCMIYYSLFKNNNIIINLILHNTLLKAIGKVSYGVYLFHLFIPEMWLWIITKFENKGIDIFWNKAMPQKFQPIWIFLQEFSFLLFVCIISWNLIEKPVNNMKQYFKYKKANTLDLK